MCIFFKHNFFRKLSFEKRHEKVKILSPSSSYLSTVYTLNLSVVQSSKQFSTSTKFWLKYLISIFTAFIQIVFIILSHQQVWHKMMSLQRIMSLNLSFYTIVLKLIMKNYVIRKNFFRYGTRKMNSIN